MSELASKKTIFGTVAANEKLDYGIGDFVTVVDRYKNYINTQITAIQYTWAGVGILNKSVTFGKAPLDIRQAMNTRLSGLNNILTS